MKKLNLLICLVLIGIMCSGCTTLLGNKTPNCSEPQVVDIVKQLHSDFHASKGPIADFRVNAENTNIYNILTENYDKEVDKYLCKAEITYIIETIPNGGDATGWLLSPDFYEPKEKNDYVVYSVQRTSDNKPYVSLLSKSYYELKGNSL